MPLFNAFSTLIRAIIFPRIHFFWLKEVYVFFLVPLRLEQISENNFLKYILWYIFINQNLSKNRNIAFILIKIDSAFAKFIFLGRGIWNFCKKFMKIFSNTFVILSLEFELF